MNLLQLAAAEAAAAARKNVAEAEWRYTWWGTSDGMVAVPDAEIKTVMQELNVYSRENLIALGARIRGEAAEIGVPRFTVNSWLAQVPADVPV